MDHLIVPARPKHSRIEVPLRARGSYSGPFDSFLSRHGWNQVALTRSDLLASQIDELQSLLQTWLFFGLVEEVFGSSSIAREGQIQESDVVWVRRGNAGPNVLSTIPLRPLLRKLGDNDISKERLMHISNCLKTTADVLNLLSLSNSPLVQTEEFLAIAVLCDAIDKSIGTFRDAFRASGQLDLGVSRYLQIRMLEDGWCRNDVHRLQHQLDLPSLYLASNLEPPEQEVTHVNCTETLCRASQVDESRYSTVHDGRTCDGTCAFIGVSQDELAGILLSGTLPLIDYDPDSDPNTIRLVPFVPGMPYVAISHVWSHGLGNQIDNALLKCQLRRISKYVSCLPHGSESGQPVKLFWLDTICFPLHNAEAANRALVYMRKSYQDATHVLVIDRYLTGVESQPLLHIEVPMRILCSSWTRRLWTLQEGVLAQKLFFQFGDVSLDMAHIGLPLEMTTLTHDRSLEYLPIWLMASELWEAWKTRDSEDPKTVLNYLSGGLRWRATSVAADEALCLATLIGLDMEALMDRPDERRMERFWSLMPSISAQAVFWSGPRINSPGFRWAPSSFLGQSAGILQDLDMGSDTETPRLTDQGLGFCCAGILLNTWRSPLDRDVWIRLDVDGPQWFHLRRQETQRLEPKIDNHGDGDEDEHYSRSLVLLMKTSITAAFLGEQPPKRSVTCILASVYDVDEEKDIIFANTEDVAFLIPASKEPRNDLGGANLYVLVAELSETRLQALDVGRTASAAASTSTTTKTSGSGTEPTDPEVCDGDTLLMAAETEDATGGVPSLESLANKMRCLLSENEELRTARVTAREEDGRLSVDKDGVHYVFYGVELSEDQEWCLD